MSGLDMKEAVLANAGGDMFAVTGATGQLGRLVIERLLAAVEPSKLVAAVRSPEKANDLTERNVVVREANYDRPETLAAAFRGVEKLLLISSNAVGIRLKQHEAAIEAARAAGVGEIVYTSMLHADATPAKLAVEHFQTEQALQRSGVPAVILRNGWYFENQMLFLPHALAQGEILGAAGDGRFSAAACADYADAAAIVLTQNGHAGKIYELAGDASHTLADLAVEVSRQSGRDVAFRNLSEADYRDALVAAGLAAPLAAVLADEDACSAEDTLFDERRELSRLIGRPTATLRESVAAALSRNGSLTPAGGRSTPAQAAG